LDRDTAVVRFAMTSERGNGTGCFEIDNKYIYEYNTMLVY